MMSACLRSVRIAMVPGICVAPDLGVESAPGSTIPFACETSSVRRRTLRTSRVRTAYLIVHAIQTATPATNITRRRPPLESGGSWASLRAMAAWKGLVGPTALPTIAAPARGLIVSSVVLPAGKHPRERRGDNDRAAKKEDGVR